MYAVRSLGTDALVTENALHSDSHGTGGGLPRMSRGRMDQHPKESTKTNKDKASQNFSSLPVPPAPSRLRPSGLRPPACLVTACHGIRPPRHGARPLPATPSPDPCQEQLFKQSPSSSLHEPDKALHPCRNLLGSFRTVWRTKPSNCVCSQQILPFECYTIHFSVRRSRLTRASSTWQYLKFLKSPARKGAYTLFNAHL